MPSNRSSIARHKLTLLPADVISTRMRKFLGFCLQAHGDHHIEMIDPLSAIICIESHLKGRGLSDEEVRAKVAAILLLANMSRFVSNRDREGSLEDKPAIRQPSER